MLPRSANALTAKWPSEIFGHLADFALIPRSPVNTQPAKARRTAGFRAEVSGTLGKHGLGGGAGSLERTRLWGLGAEFPVKQGKNREFSQNQPRIADLYGLSDWDLKLFCQIP